MCNKFSVSGTISLNPLAGNWTWRARSGEVLLPVWAEYKAAGIDATAQRQGMHVQRSISQRARVHIL